MRDYFNFNNPDDFEKAVAIIFRGNGYKESFPPANNKGFDIELKKKRECIAVQVKNLKAKCNISYVKRFFDFLTQADAVRFTQGWIISSSGFTEPAITFAETEGQDKIRLGTYRGGEILWNDSEEGESKEANRPLTYIGVFTCKGGVGKTTISAHLAGAFALMHYDVALLDLDPAQHLHRLFYQGPEDYSLVVPSPKSRKYRQGAVISVYSHDQWTESPDKNTKIIICDCSPVIDQNPEALIRSFDYCIIPTTLNPLGIAKNSEVIISTFRSIRRLNSKAKMFALINLYDPSRDHNPNTDKEKRRPEALLNHMKTEIAKYSREDPLCWLIDPDSAKIRQSNALFYWGYHIIDGSKPTLAFREYGGKSYPREDFLELADYLEEHTEIDKLRSDRD